MSLLVNERSPAKLILGFVGSFSELLELRTEFPTEKIVVLGQNISCDRVDYKLHGIAK